MTTVVAWVSYSPTGELPELPRAAYLASDSRITWGSQLRRWDAGRKIFSAVSQPHVFGYSGDVVFPSLVLGQLVSAIDQGILFGPEESHQDKNALIFESMRTSHRRRHNVVEQDFSVLHICRWREWPATAFAAWLITYKRDGGVWACQELAIPTATKLISTLGSGANSARTHAGRWNASNVGGTSRAIFSAFCDAVASNDDALSGGLPQLAGLYTEGPPRNLGFIEDGSAFLHGLQIKPGAALASIEWRDKLFQRIDPTTMLPFQGARRFARPQLG
ncbi:MAG: hypothetical protein B7W99_01635 [Rhodospirillales bacterium 20-58-10]|nr:MAG: hypothetical protein B7W99_01635 [Rhodospirillales bacterium 20-58-10]